MNQTIDCLFLLIKKLPMKNKGRFITFSLRCAVVVAMIVVLYPLLTWAVGRVGVPSNVRYIPNNYGHMGLRLAEADTSMPDLLFVGSSHCYRTFDSRFYDSLGHRSFNLGSSNQTPVQSAALLRRYLQRWHPQLVVVEVHPDVVQNNGVESAVDIISNTYLDPPLLAMATNVHSIKVFNTMLCALIDRAVFGSPVVKASRTFPLPHPYISDSTIAATYTEGGFVEASPVRWRTVEVEPSTIVPDKKQIKALKEIIMMLEQQEIGYLFVEVPATRARYLSYSNHAEFERLITSLLPKGRHLLNLNDDTALTSLLNDTICYSDDDHLNQEGTTIFNRFFYNKYLCEFNRHNQQSRAQSLNN